MGEGLRRTLLVLGALVVSMSGLAPGSATGSSASTHWAGVLGYVESGDGLSALQRNLPGLSSVGVDGVNINVSGTAVSGPDADALAMLAEARGDGKPVELLVGNYNGAIGDFDPASAHRLFASARNRRVVTAALVADVRRGWSGIHLDFESLRGSDRGGLTRFTAELRAALPPRASLSMAVMASTTSRGYRDDGYDLPRLARELNRVVLMAYDQHGPTWSKAGPIGGLPWARRALVAMLRSVPRRKAMLGVAGYGYTWPSRGAGTQLSVAAARDAGDSPVWDAAQAEWHSTLRDGGTVWWSDARSLQVREELARSLGVRGVAVWSLGLCDVIAG